MIHSILDTDLYKFTTSHAYMRLFPEAEGSFIFIDRDHNTYTAAFVERLQEALQQLATLRLAPEELQAVLHNRLVARVIPLCYWEWLSQFHFDPSKIKIWLGDDCDSDGNRTLSSGRLHLQITDKLYKATLYEVPLLAIISELRGQMAHYPLQPDAVLAKLANKIAQSNHLQLKFADFGTRRRFSYALHDQICACLKRQAAYCVGTSNLHLALKYQLPPSGTFPHEWVMFHGAIFGYKMANYLSLEDWLKVYDGDLGIALMDTYTTVAFLKNFSRKHAKLFDGVRLDSGDEYQIGQMVIHRYRELGIDPTTKTIIFSNATNFTKYAQIAQHFKNQIQLSAGIGTNLTNDVGLAPANIVIKLAKCRISQREQWQDCIKISDDSDKMMGDYATLQRAIDELQLAIQLPDPALWQHQHIKSMQNLRD